MTADKEPSSIERDEEQPLEQLQDLEIYAQAVASTQDQLAALDRDCRYLMANAAYAEFFGYRPDELIGRHVAEIFSGGTLEENVNPGLARCMLGEVVSFEEWRQSARGEARCFSIVYTPLHDHDGPLGVLVSAHDITALQAAQAQLERIAHHDPLTGLPNRILLDIILQRSLKQAHRDGSRLAVMFIDLDRFKAVNDSLGHAAGDEVLRLAAHRLQAALRDSDSLARVGGDEFVAVLAGIKEAADLSPVANKLMEAVCRPYKLGQELAQLSCSIGISLFPDDAGSADQLLSNADTAMYEAKEQGRNDWRFFDAAMTTEAADYLALVGHLRRALKDGGLNLVFHPEFSRISGDIVAIEALARWDDPQLGTVAPERFIAAAEKAGMIRELDFQTLEAACAQLAVWQQDGLAPPRLGINVSGQTLNHSDTPRRVRATLDHCGLRPEQLEFEVRERSLLENPEQTTRGMQALQTLGVGLVVDGFGMGFPGIRCLQSVPLRALKIDSSYLGDVSCPNSQRMVRAMIAMGKALGVDVVMGGVETLEQADFLSQEPQAHGQGYYLSEPLTADAMGHYLRKRVDAGSGATATS